MTDTEYSDDERYANESFENETDTEVPETSEVESETSVNSEDDGEEDDEDELPSVKMNTQGPIKRSFSNILTTIHKTDVVPFASSSEEEDDVIVGQTMAEINTPSMHLVDESPTPSVRYFMPVSEEKNKSLKSVEEETQESSDEISEEEDDEEEEEFKRIKDMEEKYIQLNSGKTSKEINGENTNSFESEKRENENPQQNDDQEIDSEDEDNDEAEEDDEFEMEERDEEVTNEENLSKEDINSLDNKSEKYNSLESLGQNNLIQLLQSSMTNFNIESKDDITDTILIDTQSHLMREIESQSININILNPETVATAVVNALKSSSSTNFSSLIKPQTLNQITIEEIQEDEEEYKNDNKKESNEEKEIEIVDYQDDYEDEEEVKLEGEEFQNSDAGSVHYDDERDVYYDAHFDYRITSKTPTSFNSDDYIFHANFIKQFHRTNSTDKLRVKPHPRKSMSFSNERMREIERHNQILLRKILTQKPTYTLKNKTSQSSLQKVTSQTNTRLTTSAVNRKKQQRQIDLDNQILKRKIEAIGMRRRPLIT